MGFDANAFTIPLCPINNIVPSIILFLAIVIIRSFRFAQDVKCHENIPPSLFLTILTV